MREAGTLVSARWVTFGKMIRKQQDMLERKVVDLACLGLQPQLKGFKHVVHGVGTGRCSHFKL